MKSGLNSLGAICLLLIAACTSTTTTIRFKSDHEAVAVQNPDQPKAGDRLEALIGTRKRIFFYVPAWASVTSFSSSVDPVVNQKKPIATLAAGGHSLRLSIIQLSRPLAINGAPSAENMAAICSNPTISPIIAGAPTEIVGVNGGSWIATSSKRMFLRPLDTDLVAVVDAIDIDFAHSRDFVLRIGSLTAKSSR